jgi:hypothetical protein
MPIINYHQMKTIFDQLVVVNIKNLFFPSNLMAAINHPGDNKADGTTFVDMTPADMMTWLRTWLCKHHC